MVEANAAAVHQLQATREKLQAKQVEIVRGDACATAQSLLAKSGDAHAAGRFQLIFLDPPYHQAWLPKILPLCESLLAEGGFLYVETEQALENDTLPEWMSGWQTIRADKAGAVFYHLLQRKIDARI
jgi:16S rRNA G966 N2-methylase RsmD